MFGALASAIKERQEMKRARTINESAKVIHFNLTLSTVLAVLFGILFLSLNLRGSDCKLWPYVGVEMVKIKKSISKKRYMHKRIYQYLRLNMPISSRYYENLKPYLEEQFQNDLKEDEEKVTISYTYFKTSRKQKWTRVVLRSKNENGTEKRFDSHGFTETDNREVFMPFAKQNTPELDWPIRQFSVSLVKSPPLLKSNKFFTEPRLKTWARKTLRDVENTSAKHKKNKPETQLTPQF